MKAVMHKFELSMVTKCMFDFPSVQMRQCLPCHVYWLEWRCCGVIVTMD